MQVASLGPRPDPIMQLTLLKGHPAFQPAADLLLFREQLQILLLAIKLLLEVTSWVADQISISYPFRFLLCIPAASPWQPLRMRVPC